MIPANPEAPPVDDPIPAPVNPAPPSSNSITIRLPGWLGTVGKVARGGAKVGAALVTPAQLLGILALVWNVYGPKPGPTPVPGPTPAPSPAPAPDPTPVPVPVPPPAPTSPVATAARAYIKAQPVALRAVAAKLRDGSASKESVATVLHDAQMPASTGLASAIKAAPDMPAAFDEAASAMEGK